ncbi:DNA repair protein RecO [bacterium (Candidatus Blackallbacteria) CG17_big_fil_post_rev_8_21_14_2_50_48_46]|uniref:DNA repair protein RecO n=1 Tax=bacterium (Candidatus Blackallbacteria) CG17_big_fil_post_rev_8_21_14_2_50_48_46 TaxID=2014261 RepID=A0A2M7G2T8_9BACT|nr:MAG: DNA repair protein RecO [bacterium (Candidatus Blackallbacteria) CG18_big_fil_WC_8_21_14_2_50_49_26]PIW15959.1 MAG: DNA repair protein RecO [bacterium (Candidatus Blackallbacteria) CG17_big_fil_post_rev_8_21_14_2_50_48_46]PIW50371.1 MAG: DNA repair protein RecO [bacterium (Candidatus Blackallbacteria) CG13_big_fil_rev_8_21_14_2_50_49_14]
MSNLPPNRHPFEVEAFALKHYDFNEHDRVIVLFSRKYGLLRAVAKGVRRPKSKLAGHLDLLRCNHVLLERGRNLHKIIQCDSLHSFPGLTRDYDALTHALALGEIMATFCQEEDPNEYLFVMLLHALEALSSGTDPLTLLIWFELHLLYELGYEQDWEFCRGCEIDFRPRDYHFFDTLEGGLRCEDCKRKQSSQFLSYEQVATIRDLQASAEPPTGVPEIKHIALKQIQTMLQNYLELLAEKPMKALSFLQETSLEAIVSKEMRKP